jgi:hypothetical protein
MPLSLPAEGEAFGYSLPPYLPDLNLIEETFIDAKTFIGRHYLKKRRNNLTSPGFPEGAVNEVGPGVGAARRARG